MKFRILVFISLLFVGCFGSSDQANNGGSDFIGEGQSGCGISQADLADKDLVLVNYLVEHTNPKLERFIENSKTMTSALRKSCSVEALPVTQLRQMWQDTMDAFHDSEPILYGPLLLQAADKVGDFNPIKERLYSIQDPSFQAEDIEMQIEEANFEGEAYEPIWDNSIQGLDALEYLLYGSLDRDQLAPGDDECAFMELVLKEYESYTAVLEKQWTQKVVEPLKTANGQTKSAVYITEMLQGLVAYGDKVLKDQKMAFPLGIQPDNNKKLNCQLGVDCHSKYLEHPYSKTAHRALIIGLKSVEQAFDGRVGEDDSMCFGINDYMQLKGIAPKQANKTMTQRSLSGLWQALPEGEEFYQIFSQFDGVEDSSNPAYLAFRETQSFTTWLKRDLMRELNVKLPGNVQGDND